MQDLSFSLLRERFDIHDRKLGSENEKEPVIALSNRIALDLKNKDGETVETFIIRTQNMHSCVRMSAQLIRSFSQGGALLNRTKGFDWERAWDAVMNNYEHSFNPQRWVAVYHEGALIYSKGERNPLLDLIEQCDHKQDGDYDSAVKQAEALFNESNSNKIDIEHDSNVALVVNLEKKQGRCGIILRGAEQTKTFNFAAKAPSDKTLNFPQCALAAAAFLEGVQLAFQVGMDNIKISWGVVPRLSREEKQNRAAQKRLIRLRTEIRVFEDAFTVSYRPERPEFEEITLDAEDLAKSIFERRDDR